MQIEKFRSLKQGGPGSAQLANNYRPPLALNDRTVYLTYHVSSAPAINGRGFLSVVACLAAFLAALAMRY